MLEPKAILAKSIEAALLSFETDSLADASIYLLKALGYASEKTTDLGRDAAAFLTNIAAFKPDLGPISRDKVYADRWKSCAFLFQLTNDEIPSLAIGQALLVADTKIVRTQIESFVFLAIELEGDQWSRTALAGIARELNRRFPMPSVLLFRHGDLFSLAVIDRRVSLRDATRDVVESKITVVKDVRFANPHRAHIDILAGMALASLGELKEGKRPSNFRQLYDAWIEALSIQALNKRFYTELACWYYWAVKAVDFPQGGGADKGKRNSVAVIRLLTRLIFIWFIKEKGLAPDALFEVTELNKLLKQDPATAPNESTYYLAILQNLFFATLNVEMGSERKWAQQGAGVKGDRLIHSLYRHKEHFKDPDGALKLFSRIPFLNGGLFECLDRELTERDFQREPELKKVAVKEGSGWVLRVDGFSRRTDAQPKVPNKIFFGGESNVDLDEELGTSRRPRDVFGLVDLFSRYKFTVDENTPVEEEVALDPELLGKVFENLLASYNEDTKSTARKQSGSFYTPREVVDYMVDEALVAYFVQRLVVPPISGKAAEHSGRQAVNALLKLDAGSGDLALTSEALAAAEAPMEADDGLRNGMEARLRQLLSYTAEGNPFNHVETARLIAGIEAMKMLDPACGSGAFPMGMLTKLVHTLKKLDPDNREWRSQNLRPLQAQLESARKIPDPNLREAKIEEAESSIEKTQHDFDNAAHADYTRKLYLIEKCIHGVDIQPIAVQIAKLRFFISLIVSQDVDPTRENWGITALPNLETKIVAADSLTPIDRPAQAGLRDPDIDHKEAELTLANEHYFAARTSKTKRKWRDQIFTLRDELASLLEVDLFLSKGAAEQLVHWNPFDQNQEAKFFDPEWMFQISDGFDITIGNPPYVSAGAIRELKPQLRKSFGAFFDGNADLFTYFYRRGFDLLKPGGVLAYISSNKFMRTGYGAKTRKLLAREAELRVVIDFGEQPVFGASVDSAIVVVQKPRTVIRQKAFKAVAIKAKEEIAIAGQILAERGESYFPNAMPDDGWLFESSLVRKTLERMQNAGRRLDDIVQGHFYRGILTGFNDAFVIDGATKARLVAEDPQSEAVIKPFLNGREMLRWHCSFSDQWLLYLPWHFPLHDDATISGNSTVAEKTLKKQYPAIYAHLSRFKEQLLSRNQDETGIRYEWYALQRWGAEYWHEFEKRKLIFNETSKELHAFIDDTNLYINKTGFMIIHDEVDYLLGVMNSQILDYYYRHNFPAWGDPWNGGRIQFRKDRMVDAPIPWPEKGRRDLVATCARVVSTIYQSGLADVAGTTAPRFEQLINGLVFELFFPADLHRANIRLVDACEKAGVGKLATLDDKALVVAANELAARIFANDHAIYAMLFDLQGLDVVRAIEGRE